MFRQSLSDLTLDRSKVRPDKLLCVNSHLECIIDAERDRKNIERFAKEHEMVFNTSKSKLILFPAFGNTKLIIPFMGGAIEYVADHSHLDCIIDAERDR